MSEIHLPTTSLLADILEHFVEQKEQPSPSEDYSDQANATHTYTHTHTHMHNCFMAILDFVLDYPDKQPTVSKH